MGMIHVWVDMDEREHDHPSDNPWKENSGKVKNPSHILSRRVD
jgi:hypothetical protein